MDYSPEVARFLNESNAIEGVYDSKSLDQAMRAWRYLMLHDRLTIEVVLHTHGIMMVGQPLERDERGHFRKVDVTVGGELMPPPESLENSMAVWVIDMNDGFRGWKELHVEFEKIHPFIDGNGRLGRMFMNWHRVKGYGAPILVIEEAKKREYYAWFKETPKV